MRTARDSRLGGSHMLQRAPAEDARAPGPSSSGARSRALRVARFPGSANLTAAALYAIPSFAVTSASGASGDIGVNPSAARWAIVIGVNVLHATAAAMFTYRYLVAAPFVPEAPPPAPRRRR